MSYRLPAHSRWPHSQAFPAAIRPGLTGQRSLTPASVRPACPTSRSRMTDGISPRNLSLNPEGTLRVALGRSWREMLSGLPELGTLLVITRNEAAVLARFRRYPALCFDPVMAHAEDEDGEFHFDFNWWDDAYAKHATLPRGQGYGIEFLDTQRQAFHSVALTPDSSLEALNQWLQRFQAGTPLQTPPLASSSHAELASCPSEEEEEENSTPLAPEMLLPFLQAVSAEELPIRAAVGHEAIVQQHCFRPRSVRESGTWIFASDDETGLHFDLAGIARLSQHTFSLQGRECRSIKAYHANGRLLFFLAPSGPAHLEAWNRLFDSSRSH